MDMMTTIATLLASTISSVWPDAEGLPVADEIRGLLAVPPDPAMGDYAFPCFRLAKPLRSAPPKIAEALCGHRLRAARERLHELLPQPGQLCRRHHG